MDKNEISDRDTQLIRLWKGTHDITKQIKKLTGMSLILIYDEAIRYYHNALLEKAKKEGKVIITNEDITIFSPDTHEVTIHQNPTSQDLAHIVQDNIEYAIFDFRNIELLRTEVDN